MFVLFLLLASDVSNRLVLIGEIICGPNVVFSAASSSATVVVCRGLDSGVDSEITGNVSIVVPDGGFFLV
jgi:hypothetical protein